MQTPRASLATLLLTCCVAVVAQPAATPTRSHLDAERARIEAERKRMFDPGNTATQAPKSRMPSAGDVKREIERIEGERKQLFDPDNPATRGAPNAFPNVQTPAPDAVDVEAMARRYEQKAEARRVDGLMVFASFTMPTESLKRLIADTGRVGGVVVMRGFKDGSVKATGQAIHQFGQASNHVQVNPNAFTKYRIGAVPAVVLAKPAGIDVVDNEGCALPDQYAKVAGDVGLSYALDHIGARSPEFREMAERYVRPLKGKTP